MKYRILLLISVILLFSNFIFAQSDKTFAKVGILIDFESKEIRNELYSYLAREIRSLKDVSIVEKDADYIVSVTMIENRLQNNELVGYAMSVTIQKRRFCLSLVKNQKNKIQYYLDLMDEFLFVFPQEDLRNRASKVITLFDTRILEPTRKNTKVINDVIEKMEKNKN
jgi:hypothetical protein